MSPRLSIVEAPEPRRLSIRLATKRLEESPLYLRREQAAGITKAGAVLAALWYLSDTFQPRWK